MSALQKEIRITISPDNITIAKAANLSRDGKWMKDTIKLEMSIAMIFHKVLNRHRLAAAFEKNDYEILGKMLFKILTASDDVKKFLMDGLRDIMNNEPARCRIYLAFKESVDDLATLPWEYLLIEKDDDDKIGAPFYIAADSRLKFDFIR
ncbi:MAG TPA: hypothetical protein VNU70_10470, partial [Puia sp.]|nr:hypothetical protein [Puia sp.]